MAFELSAHNYLPTSLEKLEQEISQLEKRLTTLKVLRNSFTPFARLHPEIIQEIFVLTSRRSQPNQFGKTSLSISWVCHRWRDLAHQTSELWSYIDFINPAWVEAALSRTHSRVLDFNLQVSRPLRDGELSRLSSLYLENIPRIRILSLDSQRLGDRLFQSGDVKPLGITLAPLLVELTLHSTTLSSTISSSFLVLQRLTLTGCSFSWESLPIRGPLKHLHVLQPATKVSAEILMKQISTIALDVESLHFGQVLHPTTNLPPASNLSPTRQLLPKLRRLEIFESHARPVTFILNRLSIPPRLDFLRIQVSDIPNQL